MVSRASILVLMASCNREEIASEIAGTAKSGASCCRLAMTESAHCTTAESGFRSSCLKFG